MAGGWGYSIHAPLEIPAEPLLRYLDDDMPEVADPSDLPKPDAINVDTSLLRRLNKAMPEMPGGNITERGRMQDAAEFAAAMGNAFAVTKSYNEYYAKRAEAKGRATERAAQHKPNSATNRGRMATQRNKRYEKGSGLNAAFAFGYHPYKSMY